MAKAVLEMVTLLPLQSKQHRRGLSGLFHHVTEEAGEVTESREGTLQTLKQLVPAAGLIACLCIGTVDCVVDWFVYAKVLSLYETPSRPLPSVHFAAAMAVFCVAGTATYLAETWNALQAFFLGRVSLPRDLLASATLWLEDLPLTVLNTLLVAMSFMAVDAFQLAKALVVLLGAMARASGPVCRHCQERRLPTPTAVAPGPRDRAYLALLLTGTFLNVTAAVLFFAVALRAFESGG